MFHAAAGSKPGELASSGVPFLAAAALAGDAQQTQQAQQQVLHPHGAVQSAALPFMLLPQWARPEERAALVRLFWWPVALPGCHIQPCTLASTQWAAVSLGIWRPGPLFTVVPYIAALCSFPYTCAKATW